MENIKELLNNNIFFSFEVIYRYTSQEFKMHKVKNEKVI